MLHARALRLGTAVVLAALGCGGSGPVAKPAEPALAEADFNRPWVWKSRIASGKSIDAIAWGPAGYVAIAHAPTLDGKAMPPRNNIVAVSADGVSWAETAIDPNGHYNSITYGAGRYFAAGGQVSGGGLGRIIASVDGLRWTQVSEAGAVLQRIRHTEGGFIAVGMNGVVLTSSDGTSWVESHVPTLFLNDATFGAGRFVLVGFTLSVGTPSAGWSAVPCGPQLPCMDVVDPSGVSHGILQLYSIEYGNGVFVTQGVAGLLRSSDGLSWTQVGPSRSPLGFAGGRFLALSPVPDVPLGTSYRVSVSSDAQSWDERTTAATAQTDDTCARARCLLLPEGLLLIPPPS